MKKTLFLAAMLLFVNNSFAQLIVDSLGHVRIGSTDAPTSVLTVGSTNISGAGIGCSHTGKYGMYLSANGLTGEPAYGLKISSFSYNKNYGIHSQALRSGGSSPYAYGVMGLAGLSENSIGVYGGIQGYTDVINMAGIYGTNSAAGSTSFSYPGSYAGYFKGKLLATGTIYGTVTSLSNALNRSSSATTFIQEEDEEPVISRLSQVRNVLFSINDLDEEAEKDSLEKDLIYSKVHHGLDAEQLAEIYPELVEKDKRGNYWVNYIELVPILVKGINELSKELAELKGTSSKKVKSQTTAIEDTVEDIDQVRMDQNKPNPFSESTVIKLNIPKDTKTATIFIYDLSGKQVKSIPVSERGKTDITVYARDLSAGMYIYSLVVDGQVKVTRRMMVTK
ncbi:MAG: T9SS type A sorting domain-containing protein [Bacteroidaceae bacterium]|nr:T9SS type A sorting domain-containing protein [Bacteroidaceae bacterium]